MGVDAQKAFEEIRSELSGMFQDIQKSVDASDRETREKHASLESKLSSVIDSVNSSLAAKEADLQTRMDEFEKRMARKGFIVGDSDKPTVKSFGQQFVESQQFKDSRAKNSFGCDRIKIKGSLNAVKHATKTAFERRSLDLTESELGGLVQEFRWEQIVQNPLRPRRIAALIPSVPVNSNQVEYPEENVVHVLYTELTGAALATDTSIQVERTAGFYPGQKVRIGPVGGTTEVVTLDAGRGAGLGVDEAAKELNFTPALANGYAIGTEATSTEYAYTPQAKFKPHSRVEYVAKTANIKTLATLMDVSRQMLDDFNGLSSLIDARMTEFIELSQERQLLYGSGGSFELDGILTHPDINVYLQAAVATDNKIDALRRAKTLNELAFLPVDAIVVHPLDWEAIELEKDDEKRYLTTQVHVSQGITVLWQTPVISTPVIDQLTALVASFRMGSVRWDRQDVSLMMFDQNRDNAERNMVTLRAEMREGFSVIRPKSFTKVTFS